MVYCSITKMIVKYRGSDNMKKIFALYPPGEIYQRGEDRCQINVGSSVSNSLRACNDLGYVASILKNTYSVIIKDYPAEQADLENFKEDFKSIDPDIVFISITNGSIFNDIEFVKLIKSLKKETLVIFKGALFFNPDELLFDELDLTDIDYLIGGEIEFIIDKLLDANYNDKAKLKDIQGIAYNENGKWVINKVTDFCEDLDSVPFPDSFAMNNALYINPMTNRKMATVSTSKGCPSSCIYCVSPVISGRKVRYRSPKNIFEEITECVEKHDIVDFFFKSDTFTINKNWVIELCDLIINSSLSGKISWVANSRANTLDEELLLKMKQAGCTMIALGLESGSDESLQKMRKGVTVAQNKRAVEMVKKAGLQSFGFYLVGFPWEGKKHLAKTKKLMFDSDTDFIELSVATPFKGSELYNMIFCDAQSGEKVLGKDSFRYTTMGTDFLTQNELAEFRRKTIIQYHLRPKYIFKKIFNKNISFSLLKNYFIYGFRMLRNFFLKG